MSAPYLSYMVVHSKTKLVFCFLFCFLFSLLIDVKKSCLPNQPAGVMNAKLLARYKQSITASEDKAEEQCEMSDGHERLSASERTTEEDQPEN